MTPPPVCRWGSAWGTCHGPVGRYLDGWACQHHSPAGRRGATVPVPDPSLTLEGFRARSAKANAATQLRAATTARDDAMARVDDAAPNEWRDAARRAVWHLATTRESFTTDDVWQVLADWGVTTQEPRALGPVVMRALRAGAITRTGERVPSTRRHATRIDVYTRGAKP